MSIFGCEDNLKLNGFIFKYQGIRTEKEREDNIDSYSLQNLNNRQLYLPSPTEINDPFDARIHFRKSTEDELIEDMKEGGNYSDFIKKGIKIEDTIKQEDDAIKELNIGTPSDNATESIRIGSFTTNPRHHLMWSHYADSHRGLCLIFNLKKYSQYSGIKFRKTDIIDTNNMHYPNGFIPLLKVKYKKNPPEGIRFGHHESEQLSEHFRTKYIDWKYEDEYRILISRRMMKRSQFLQYPKSSLFGIIFGFYTPQEDIQAVLNITKDYNLKYFKVHKRESSYKMDIASFSKLNIDPSSDVVDTE